MSSFEHIFFRAGVSPEAAAEQLARLPGMAMNRDEKGRVFVTRRARAGNERAGGEVSTNEHTFADEETAFDGYDIVFEIFLPKHSREEQIAEAERTFEESTRLLGWPALLVQNLDLISAAWSPEHGLTRFPPGTTPDPEHASLWKPVAVSGVARKPDH